MKNKIRCLICGMSSSIGGIETYVITQFRALNKDLFHYDFVFSHKEGDIAFGEEIAELGSKVYRITNSKQWKEFLLAHSGDYDLLIFNTPAPVFLPFINGKRFGNFKKIIVHSHNSRSDMPWYIKNFVPFSFKYVQLKMRYAKAEKWACSQLAGRFMFGKAAEFTIIRNAIELEKFRFSKSTRNIIRSLNNTSDNSFVIGLVGRFDYQKNHRFAIEIFRKYHEKNNNAELWLIGPESRKELADEIHRSVYAYGLSDSVKFFGALSNVNEYYQAMDVFILPSLFEGLPISGIEAQASGVPCLFSDTITRELVVNSDNVEYLSIDGADAASVWSNHIEDIAQNYDAYFQMREKAYLKVKEAGYDINAETRRVEKLFMDMCKG